MSSEQPSPATEPRGDTPPAEPESRPAQHAGDEARPPTRPSDPLRGSRTSGTWLAVLVLIVVLVLLAVFILQNTQSTQVSFLGWSGSAPLSATLLIAAAGGAVLVAAAGALRILQLRRRVKRERKRR